MAISQELCKYSSRFHALSGREETIFETNDYFVDFECDFMSLALLIRLNILIVYNIITLIEQSQIFVRFCHARLKLL